MPGEKVCLGGRYAWGEGKPGKKVSLGSNAWEGISAQHDYEEQCYAESMCDRQVPYSTSMAEVLNFPKATLSYSLLCYGDSPTTKLFLFLPPSCNFAIVMNHIIKL